MLPTLIPVDGDRIPALVGITKLAAFLGDHPELPVPREITVVLAPSSATEGERLIRRAARELGVLIKTAPNGTQRAERAFGPLRYAVVYMPMLTAVTPIGGAR